MCHERTPKVFRRYIRVSHVTRMDEPFYTHGCVMSHMWTIQETHCMKKRQGIAVWHMNESYHTYEWVISHIWMIHYTHMNLSCLTCEWVMSHFFFLFLWDNVKVVCCDMSMSHVTHMNESVHTHECVTHMKQSCHIIYGMTPRFCVVTYE